MCKIKFVIRDEDNQAVSIDIDRYKNGIIGNRNKYMIYAVAKGYGSLDKAMSMTLNEICEAYSALILFRDEENSN